MCIMMYTLLVNNIFISLSLPPLSPIYPVSLPLSPCPSISPFPPLSPIYPVSLPPPSLSLPLYLSLPPLSHPPLSLSPSPSTACHWHPEAWSQGALQNWQKWKIEINKFQ